jgi:hypothetical protein
VHLNTYHDSQAFGIYSVLEEEVSCLTHDFKEKENENEVLELFSQLLCVGGGGF